MYRIKRQENLKETLLIEYKDKELVVNVEMNITEKMKAYTSASRKLEIFLTKASKNEVDSKALGEAIVSLFVLIFGEKQTNEIIAFYDDDYTSMLIDIMPFIRDVVTPMFAKARKEKIALMKKNTKRRFI
ncbi:hypothetical protein [uncultured Traorella sp.]|uniref:hypothetical protein n=1 Tax=uncultured Traorella sp. TaxID=1929048 RepID=UPI0025DE57B8|nr:hypothetical protein [uncultured Traorella sp.]